MPTGSPCLARVNSLLLAPQIALWSAGVPLRSSVRPDVLERTGVAAALAWIRVAVDPEGLIGADLDADPPPPEPRLSELDQQVVRELPLARGPARRRSSGSTTSASPAASARWPMTSRCSRRRPGPAATPERCSSSSATGSGSAGAMEMLDGSKGTQATASHLDDLEALIQVSDLHRDPNTFEPWLRASLEESSGSEGVTLSTVHRVKGREWDRVVVFGVTEGLLPHRLSADWESERRVLHVAITRAIDRCVVLGDESRRSAFLDELTGVAAEPATAPRQCSLRGRAVGARGRRRDPGAAGARPDRPTRTRRPPRRRCAAGARSARRRQRSRLRRPLQPPARRHRRRDARRLPRAARLRGNRAGEARALRRRDPRRARLGAQLRRPRRPPRGETNVS